MTLVDAALLALATPLAAGSAYLLVLTLLSRTTVRPPHSTRQLRFDLIVPAHNEAAGIGRTIASLHALDWPADCFRVLVVADNCTDATADAARAAGAHVLERRDLRRRGKGHALGFGFAASRMAGWADAVAIVDADSCVTPNLLEAFAARFERGAAAVQAHYGVLNPRASWRTQLMAIAFGCFHRVRSRTRERLALSCGLRGNGWCVTHRALVRVPYCSYSLAEDIEYGLALGRAGLRVHYADEAEVAGDMVGSERASRSQRRRWEEGRQHLRRTQLPRLIASAVRTRSAVCLDLACDLMLPPLATLALGVATLTAAGALLWLRDPAQAGWLVLGLGCVAALTLHVLRGAQLSGLGLGAVAALAHAPAYVAWKAVLMLKRAPVLEWVRTERDGAGTPAIKP